MSWLDINQSAEQERLVLLAEELAEATQAVAKILRHGWESSNPSLPQGKRRTNRQELEQELGDVLAAIRVMQQAGDITPPAVKSACASKLVRAQAYLHHDANRGHAYSSQFDDYSVHGESFEFGVWYPIASAGQCETTEMLVWVPTRAMAFLVFRDRRRNRPPNESDLDYWTLEYSGEPATHWMPPPPGPPMVELI